VSRLLPAASSEPDVATTPKGTRVVLTAVENGGAGTVSRRSKTAAHNRAVLWAAIAKYGVGWHTLKKMLAHDEPLGYRQAKHRPKPKLEPFLPVIQQILEDDGKAPTKQKHTARRIFERLRDEYGYTGGETVVKDAVREWRISRREVFLPLSHAPGEAQVDFGEATVRIAGKETKVAIFVMTLPYSGAIWHEEGTTPRRFGRVVAAARASVRIPAHR
jgi:transposase